MQANLPDFSMRQLLEAGVHFGHQSHRWNPKMGRYIYGERNGIHIIDLSKTVPLLHQALVQIRDVVAGGGRVLFVGTKRQAQQPLSEAARACAQYFVNYRWPGGTLTNWRTISNSIRRLKELEDKGDELFQLTKKERLILDREREKLDRALGGIKDMGGIPDILFVVDVVREHIAVAEAKKLNIPVVAVVDSNADPDAVDFPIPGNDDAARAIELYCDLVSRSVLDGISQSAAASGVDIGASAAPVEEPALAEAEAVVVAEEMAAGDAPTEAPAEPQAEPPVEAAAT